MSKFEYYYEYVASEAESFVSDYLDEAITEVLEGNTDMNMFIDDYRLHEWIDNDFIYVDLLDSAQIIDQSNSVESDSGLWEGQEPTDAIKTQAFFTFRNDMYFEIKEKFELQLDRKKTEIEEEVAEVELRFEHLKEQVEEKNEKLKLIDDSDSREFDLLDTEIVEIDNELEELSEKLEEFNEQISFLDTAIEDL